MAAPFLFVLFVFVRIHLYREIWVRFFQGRLVSQEDKEQLEAVRKEQSMPPPAETSSQTALDGEDSHEVGSKKLEAEPLLSWEGMPALEKVLPTGGQWRASR